MNQAEKNQVKVALVQMTCTDNKSENVEKACRQIEEAKSNGADLVCLQELFHGLYPCQAEDHDQFEQAESIPGETTERLAASAKENEIVIVSSLFERRAAGVYRGAPEAYRRPVENTVQLRRAFSQPELAVGVGDSVEPVPASVESGKYPRHSARQPTN